MTFSVLKSVPVVVSAARSTPTTPTISFPAPRPFLAATLAGVLFLSTPCVAHALDLPLPSIELPAIPTPEAMRANAAEKERLADEAFNNSDLINQLKGANPYPHSHPHSHPHPNPPTHTLTLQP